MAQVTLITDSVRVVNGSLDGDRVLVPADTLPELLGWELKPQGLCRDDVCVPVGGASGVAAGSDVDVAAAARCLGRPAVVEPQLGVAAVGLESFGRQQALDGLQAPPFTLPDLDGALHSLDEWSGSKKLLIAFSSW